MTLVKNLTDSADSKETPLKPLRPLKQNLLLLIAILTVISWRAPALANEDEPPDDPRRPTQSRCLQLISGGKSQKRDPGARATKKKHPPQSTDSEIIQLKHEGEVLRSWIRTLIGVHDHLLGMLGNVVNQDLERRDVNEIDTSLKKTITAVFTQTDPVAIEAFSWIKNNPHNPSVPWLLENLALYVNQKLLFWRDISNNSERWPRFQTDKLKQDYSEIYVNLMEILVGQIKIRGFQEEFIDNPLIDNLAYFALGVGKEFIEMSYRPFVHKSNRFLESRIQNLEDEAFRLITQQAVGELVHPTLQNFKTRIFFGGIWTDTLLEIDDHIAKAREANGGKTTLLPTGDLASGLNPAFVAHRLGTKIIGLRRLNEIKNAIYSLMTPRGIEPQSYIELFASWNSEWQENPVLEEALVSFWHYVLESELRSLVTPNLLDRIQHLVVAKMLPPGFIKGEDSSPNPHDGLDP